jgi:hypothetical protein
MRFSPLGIHTNSNWRRAGRGGLQRNERIGVVRPLVIVAATVLSVLMVGIGPSGAASPPPPSSGVAPNFSAEPYAAAGSQQRSQFVYQLLPGHRILDQVVIINASNAAESFLIYGEDATNVPQSGGYAFEQRSQMHNTVVGRWLTIGHTQLTVPAGKEVVDTFQLSIPANAPPGDHVGAVVIEELSGPGQRTPTGVNVVLRIAVPLYVRVVGKAYPGLTIENMTVFHESPAFPYLGSSKVAVRFVLANSGNDILDPKSVTVSITGLLSGTIHKYTVHQTGATQGRANPLPIQMLPGGKLTLTEEWSGIPPFDPLTGAVSAMAIDPSTAQHLSSSGSTSFWYFPWIVVLIVLALIAGVIILIRRRRQATAGGTPPTQDSKSDGHGPPPAPSMSDSETLESAGI